MPRCLFALELGENFGHLARCLPIAKNLRERGCEILFAVSDSRVAAEILTVAGFSYVQAPRLRRQSRTRASVNYSDILLGEGYGDPLSLYGGIQSWLSLFELFKPNVVIADHAPTALLSTRISSLPAVAIGTGFEIPPDVSPLPSIRPWAMVEDKKLIQADEKLLLMINKVMNRFQKARLNSLADLFRPVLKILATFPELDHFGRREGATYSGVFYQLDIGDKLCWSANSSVAKVLVYMRPNVRGFGALLDVLRDSLHEIIFVAPGVHTSVASRFSSGNLRLINSPVQFAPLLKGADIAIGYGSIGFSTQALLAGLPQLIMPEYAEQQLTAANIESLGAGIVLGEERSQLHISKVLEELIALDKFRHSARRISESYVGYVASEHIKNFSEKIMEVTQIIN